MQITPVELKETDDASRGIQNFWQLKLEILLLIAILSGVFFAVVYLAEIVASQIPDRWEAKLGSHLIDSSVNTNHEQEVLARKVFESFLKDPQLRALDYKLIVLKDSAPNAFAIPGGYVMLTTGLLDMVKTEVGLAMVLGHELGHHTHRHAMRNLSRTLLFSILSALTFNSADMDALRGTIELGQLKFSRRDEFDADAFGRELIAKHYRDLTQITEFFEELAKSKYRNAIFDSKIGSIFSTHPHLEERIARLKGR